RGAVVDAARVAGRDGAAAHERRLQRGELVECGVRSRVLVLRNERRPTFTCGDFDGNDLVVEHSLANRARGATLTLERERVLFFTRDTVLLRHLLRRHAERNRPFGFHLRVDEPPADGGVGDRRRLTIPRFAG